MQKFIARIMAMLMLLSVFGQVAAQPCAEMHAEAAMGSVEAPVAMSHGAHTGDQPMPANHCGDTPSADMANAGTHCADTSASNSDDCGQACTCCPSHCATVLPPADSAGIILPRSVHHETYTDLASSAEPESAIKPPRSA